MKIKDILVYDPLPISVIPRYDVEDDVLVLPKGSDPEPVEIPLGSDHRGNVVRVPVDERSRTPDEYLNAMLLYAIGKKEPTKASDYRWAYTHARSVLEHKLDHDNIGPAVIIGSADTQRAARDFVRNNNVKMDDVISRGGKAWADAVDYALDCNYYKINDIPFGTIALIPYSEYFGVLIIQNAADGDGFGMMLYPNNLVVYKIDE